MSPNKNSPSCVGYEPAYIQRPQVPYMRPGRPTVRYLWTYEDGWIASFACTTLHLHVFYP